MDPEEIYGTTLLRPLVREPHTLSTVDVARAVADGERRRRVALVARAGAGVTVTALLLAGGWVFAGTRPDAGPVEPSGPTPSIPPASLATPAPSTAAGPAACTVQRLDVPAGQPPKSIVTGGDPTGRYILGRGYPGRGETRSVLIWDDLKVHAVAVPGLDQELNDVTSTGTAVGTSFVGADGEQRAAWVYRGGQVSRLAGEDAEANGINEREVIVGSVNDRPAMWTAPGAAPTLLAVPGAGWTGYAAGIDEDGTVVGRLLDPAKHGDLGFRWHPDGRVEQLAVPTMRGAPVTTYTADAIRAGRITGWAALDEGDLRYIGSPLWSAGTGEVALDPSGVVANAVNRNGWTVGHNNLVVDGRVVDLPGLGASSRTTVAYTIDDSGTKLAGQTDSPDGEPVAVHWTCH